jgi:8-amino-7-oxononanoate synthase
VDFTRSLYLGITHDSEHLRWTRLTTGTPAAVELTAQARAASEAFAALVGCGRAVPLRSALHAFIDLFGQIASAPALVLHDESLYPVARWGMERVERAGGAVRSFRHHDPGALEQLLRRTRGRAPARRVCWVVCDAFCPGCAQPAPLRSYLGLAHRFGGRLLIDDTQAIGLHGRSPSPGAPYGHGGGGSLARSELARDPDVVLVASLAKAFAAPLTMVAGPRRVIDAFAAASETRVHCSPPSEVDLAAALRALAVNADQGDLLRARLASRVRTFQSALRAEGFAVQAGLFPVQRVPMPDLATAAALQAALARNGIETIVQRGRCAPEVSLTFIVTARHGEAELRTAALALAAAARGSRGSSALEPPTLEA